MKKKYSIPVTYQTWGVIYVEADSLEEATQKALERGLPEDTHYVDDSMQVDKESFIYGVSENI